MIIEDPLQPRTTKRKHDGVRYHCSQCEYRATKEVRYPCNKCEYSATTTGNLKRHIQNIHEGLKYPCNQCEYSATTAGSLKRHIQSIH